MNKWNHGDHGRSLRPWSNEALRAELADRGAERKKIEEEASAGRPKPIYSLSPGHSLYAVFDACERYIEAVANGEVSLDNDYRERQIGRGALKCIYGDEVMEWIKSK